MTRRLLPVLVVAAVLACVGMGAGAGALEFDGEVVRLIGVQTGDIVWNKFNFGGFCYNLSDDACVGTETLTIAAYTLEGPDIDRTIGEDRLVYTISPIWREYKIHKNLGLNVGGDSDYWIEFWMGEEYVVINHKAYKLAKPLVEWGSTDTRTLATGEEWNLGGGFSLVANQIDIGGDKVWFSLKKNETELDSHVLDTGNSDLQKRVYTYTEDVAGENDIPIFSCYVPAVFHGTRSNMVQVKYVFLITDNVTGICTGGDYGMMEVVTASSSGITLTNNVPIDLTSNTATPIMGNLSFKTTDNTSAIEFYPHLIREESSTYSGGGGFVLDDCQIDSPWNLSENYSIAAKDVSIDGDKARIIILKSGTVVGEALLTEKSKAPVGSDCYYSYVKNGTEIINATLKDAFRGCASNVVGLTEVYQRSEVDGSILINNESYVFKSADPTGIPWDLADGYVLTMKDIGIFNGDEVWLELSKDDITLKDEILELGDLFEYRNCLESVGCMVEAVFKGRLADVVKLGNVNQYSGTGVQLIENGSKTYMSADPTGDEWELYEGYSFVPKDIDFNGNKAWLSLLKEGVLVKDAIVDSGGDGWFEYHNSTGALVFSAYLDVVFRGTEHNIIQLKYVSQYSEIDGSVLIIFGEDDKKTLSTPYRLHKTWTVDDSGGADFTSIQAAIAAPETLDGHTILVSGGTYCENVVVDKRLTLIGGVDVVTVTANATGDHIFNVTADYVNISGFTVTGATGNNRAGICLNNANYCGIYGNDVCENGCGISLSDSSNHNLLMNNTISDNHHHYGISLDSSSNYNTIANNIINLNWCGICLSSSSGNALTNNTVSNEERGISLSYSNNNTITNNIANLNWDSGIRLFHSSNNTLINNTASNNSGGIYLQDSSNNNTITNNIINSNSYTGISVSSSHTNNLTNNNANLNRYGICLGGSSNVLTNNTANSNSNIGIRLGGSSNVLTNNTANSNSNIGIILGGSSNILSNNTASNNHYGIRLGDGFNNTLTHNVMLKNNYNFGVESSHHSDHIHNIDTSNTINEKPIYYWVNQKDKQIPSDAGYVGVVNSSNITVKDLTLTNNGQGVLFVRTSNSTIENVNASLNDCGIYFTSLSNYNTITNNTINSNTKSGIYLPYTHNYYNTITNNIISNNEFGIRLDHTRNNTLTNNTVNSNNYHGISLTHSSNNILTNNAANSNSNYGIRLYSSDNNILTNNTANSNNYQGIYLDFSSNYNTLTDNTANTNSDGGIYLDWSSHNTFINNTANSNNNYGICLYSSSKSNTLINNTANSNIYHGIYLVGSSNNIFTNNIASNNAHGIFLSSSSEYNMLANNTVSSNNHNGIYLVDSSSNILTKNIALSNGRGVFLSSSSNNTLTDNMMSNNNYNFGVLGSCLSDYINYIDASNTVDEKPVYYWVNQQDRQIPNNAGYVGIINSTNITVKDSTLINNVQGALLAYTNNSRIENVTISNNVYGVCLYCSSNNLIFHNNFVNNDVKDDNPANNSWFNPILLEGNYWFDYAGLDDGGGTRKHAVAGDEIGDTDIPHPAQDYDLYPFINKSGWLWSIRSEHDIAVMSTDAPDYAEVNSTIFINSTIGNIGLNNESNIIVNLIVNGVYQNHITIPFLESGNSTNVGFPWTAFNTTGVFNITIYVEPVLGENIPWNNHISKNMLIIVLPVHNQDTGEEFTTIQAAIDDGDTINGHTITVEAGIYRENIIINKEIILQGAGADVTIIDGGGNEHVVTVGSLYGDYVGTNTVIEGFTMQNGSATYREGAGIEICHASPIIRNNIIKDNEGWGVSVGGGGGQIKNNTISHNRANFVTPANGGLLLRGSQSIITGNMIADNGGYGIHTYSTNSFTIKNNVISGNAADGLSFSFPSGSGTANVIANTVTGNTGNGITCNPSPVLNLSNNIVASNSGHGIFFKYYYDWGEPNSNYNDVWGNMKGDYGGLSEAGSHDISEDPMFVDPENCDYHLWSGSPCIDTGTDEGAPEIDFEGDSRPIDGDGDGIAIVDMGADETSALLDHDIEPQTILTPDAEMPLGVTVTPAVRVRNIGTSAEGSFSIICKIDMDGEQTYLDTQTVTGLASLEAIDAMFADWTPREVGSYDLMFYTQLPGDENTDNDIRRRTIDVNASPDATFTLDATEGAVPLRVQFTDLSEGIITKWLWNFGDGYISTEQNPVHTYTDEGTYTVSLTVSNSDGSDTESKADYITVMSVPSGWSLPEKLTDWIGYPDVAADDSGNVFVVSECEGGPHPEMGIYFIMKPAGGTWSTPELIYTDSAEDACIAVDSTGTAHVVWQGLHDGAGMIYYSARDSDGTWSSPVQISTGFGSDWSPAIAIGGENAVHVVWHWRAGEGIFHTWKQDGGEWTVPINLKPNASMAEQPDIAANDEGLVGVIWCEDEHIQYACKNVSDSDSWSEPVTISIDVPGYPIRGSPDIVAGSDSIMHAVWDQNGVFYSKKTTSGEWLEPVLLPKVGLWGTGSPNVAIDSTGHVHVTWIGFGHSIKIVHAWSWQGSEWSSVRLFPAAGMSDASVSMAADNEGTFHLAWQRTGIQNYGIWYTSFGQVPPADFIATPTSGSAPLEVQFTDQSEGGPIGWLWDFGYGQTSTEQNPTHIYDSPGVYNVSLTVSSPPGSNKVIQTDYITVYDDPVAPLPQYTPTTIDNPDPQSWGGFGKSVALIGDVDGDGISDLLVGASRQAFVFSGVARELLLILDNPSPQSYTGFGSSVALAGDADKDGTPDFLIGAPSQEVNGKSEQGRAFVFSGATGNLLLTLDNPNPQAVHRFGGSLSSAGDINGDGVSDLLIGAGGEQAFVFDGNTGELLLALSDPDTQEYSYFGISVAPAGDINRDGVPDLLIGCPRNEAIGDTYVFSGVTGELLLTISDPTSSTRGGSFGWCVASAGDINGDDIPDLLVGAFYRGRAFVFDGATGGIILTLNLPPHEDYNFGLMSIAALEDINGDGVPDILVGEASVQRAFIFSGATGGILITLNNPESQEYAYFGGSVAAAGDVDDDGIPDLLIGAYGNRGQVFLFRSSEIIAEFNATPTSGIAPLEVQFTDNSTGNVTTWQWDFDNDGTVDSTEQNPTYTYQNAGTYAVCLKVSGTGGYDTKVKADYIAVYEAPVAEFSATPTIGVAPLEVQFTDESTGTITNWQWDFDNDNIIDNTEQNPTHIYTEFKNYTVSLTVSNPAGTDTETKADCIVVILPLHEVWVDDGWTGSSPGDPVDGHIFGIDAFASIQDGIDAVGSPGTVHVAAGAYYENINLKDGVQLTGAGADVTTVDGGMGGSVVTAINVGAGTVLDGFKINNSNPWGGGDGIHIEHGELVVSNNIISGNSEGIYAWQSSPVIKDNILINNTAGAIAISYTSSAKVTGNIVTRNEGGISVSGSFANISNNIVSNNSGGITISIDSGIVASNQIISNSKTGNFYALSVCGGSLVVSGNIVCDNHCDNYGGCYGAGMAIFGGSDAIVENNIITGNTGQYDGGGIYVTQSSPLLINNIVIDNSPKGIVGDTPNVVNCILWGNGDDLDGCTATYSNVEDGDLGEGNICANPMFVNLAGGDYHLQADSPCIDTGNNTGAPITDFDGNPRPIDGDGDGVTIVDMGIFEYMSSYPVHNLNTGLSYSTIQATIDTPETSDGHTILVDAGTYCENVVVNKSLILRGEDKNTTIIDGNGIGTVVCITSNDTTITGFTIQNSGRLWEDKDAGIWINSDYNTLLENIIANSTHGMLFGGNFNILSKNVIENNYAIGIYLDDSSNSIITENAVTNNGWDGINLHSSYNNTISENVVTHNTECGINLNPSDNNMITENTIANNDVGIGLDVPSNNNIIVGNNIADNKMGIGICRDASDNSIFHNTIVNNTNNAYDANPANNDWHHPVLLEGNYWSDYAGVDDGSGTGKHAIAGDNIGDTNLPHPGTNYDNYPFTQENAWLPHVSLKDDAYHYSPDGINDHLYTEWWYFNVYNDDRQFIVTYFLTDPANLTGMGGAEVLAIVYDEMPLLGHASTSNFSADYEKPNVTIGSNTLLALNDRTFVINGSCHDTHSNTKIRWNLTYTMDVGSWFGAPAPMHVGHIPDDWMQWLCYMTGADVAGTITINETTYNMSGSRGYHDHNWGEWFFDDPQWNWAQVSLPEENVSLIIGDVIAPPARNTMMALYYDGTTITFDDIDLTYAGYEFDPATSKLYPDVYHVTGNSDEYRIDVTITVSRNVPIVRTFPGTLPDYVIFEQVSDYNVTLFKDETPVYSLNQSGFSEYTTHRVHTIYGRVLNAEGALVTVTNTRTGGSKQSITASGYYSVDGDFSDYLVNDTSPWVAEGDVLLIEVVKDQNMGNASLIVDMSMDKQQSVDITLQPTSKAFDTGAGTHPSISGRHTGTIKPLHDVSNISTMYTYPCAGTGGHSEYVRIFGNGVDVNGTWNGYRGDYHYITFQEQFTLLADHTYNCTIETGAYPQIHHTTILTTPDGEIACAEFVDANGKRYDDWIPAFRLE